MSFSNSINKAITFFLLLTSIFAASFAQAHEEDVDGVVIHMSETGYEPNNITIKQGQKVIFENVGESDRWPASNIHPTHRGYPESDIADCNSELERFMFDACRKIEAGQTYTFQFDYVGVWKYHDHIDSTIGGEIRVLEEVVAEEEIENKTNIFQNVWNTIKSFFAQLFQQDDESFTGWEINDDIEEDSIDVVTDKDALFSYVKKYGAANALSHLFSLESEFGSCHDNAHIVGRASYELNDSDAFRECTAMCQSGCYHGAVEAYFREEGTSDLEGGINELCSDDLNPFVTHQCRHGVGHGLMAWSNYQLFEALESCDLLTTEEAEQSCYSGVFMENIVQSMASFLEIEGHTTEFLSDDPHYPCTVVDEKYEGACYYLQTDRMVALSGGDFSVVAENCAEVEDEYSRLSCYQSMGRTIGGANRGNPVGAIKDCSFVKDEFGKLDCLAGAIQDTFWDPTGTETGITFCENLNEPREKDLCYEVIIYRAIDVLQVGEPRMEFCNAVEFGYQEECREILEV